jgi:hypothetical protein
MSFLNTQLLLENPMQCNYKGKRYEIPLIIWWIGLIFLPGCANKLAFPTPIPG